MSWTDFLVLVASFGLFNTCVWSKCTDKTCPDYCHCDASQTGGFHVNCSNNDMKNVPQFPANTTTILLSYNLIEAVFENDFANCYALVHLDLSNNRISKIHKRAFNDIVGLHVLLLNNNHLDVNDSHTSLPYDIFKPLTSLVQLQIHKNKWLNLLSYRDDMLRQKPNLQWLSLDSPKNSIKLPKGFEQLMSLTILEIYGGITTLKNNTLSACAKLPIEEIYFKGGKLFSIEVAALKHLSNIKTLGLNQNNQLGLKNLSSALYGLTNSSIEKLQLANIVPRFDFEPETISKNFFDSMENTNVTELYLDINGLVAINCDLKKLFPYLQKLSLSYNRFFDNIHNVFMHAIPLEHLWYFDVSNQFKCPPKPYMPTYHGLHGRMDKNLWFFIPKNVRIMNISAAFSAAYQDIKNIILGIHPTYIQILDGSQIQLKSMEGSIINERDITIDYLNVSGCGLSSLSNALFPKNIKAEIKTVDISNNLLGDQITKDKVGDFFGQLNHVNAKVINVGGNNVKDMHRNVFSRVKTLEGIILKNNAIRSWTFSLLHITNLSFIDLSRNMLSHLPGEICRELDHFSNVRPFTLYMSENPFECNCETLFFLKWLLDTKVTVPNKDLIWCEFHSKRIYFSNLTQIIQKMTIDCASNAWVIATASTCVAILFLSFVSVVLYRYRWDIRYACLRLTRQRKQYDALNDTRTYMFDAFVAFHQNDLEWVLQELIPNTEKVDDSISLCIHQRNWMAGEPIMENIYQSVANSRKTLVLLSRNFLQSGWCEFELQMARMRAFDEGEDIIVVVALEYIPLGEMSGTLVHLRRNNTWMDWYDREEEFWSQLRRALRKARNIEND